MIEILMQGTGGDDGALPLVAQYGLLAPLLIALWFAYKREASRSDRLEEEVQRLNNVNIEKTLPAMFQVAEAMGDFTKIATTLQLQQEIDRRVAEEKGKKVSVNGMVLES